jgi:hypothetical protein
MAGSASATIVAATANSFFIVWLLRLNAMQPLGAVKLLRLRRPLGGPSKAASLRCGRAFGHCNYLFKGF